MRRISMSSAAEVELMPTGAAAPGPAPHTIKPEREAGEYRAVWDRTRGMWYFAQVGGPHVVWEVPPEANLVAAVVPDPAPACPPVTSDWLSVYCETTNFGPQPMWCVLAEPAMLLLYKRDPRANVRKLGVGRGPEHCIPLKESLVEMRPAGSVPRRMRSSSDRVLSLSTTRTQWYLAPVRHRRDCAKGDTVLTSWFRQISNAAENPRHVLGYCSPLWSVQAMHSMPEVLLSHKFLCTQRDMKASSAGGSSAAGASSRKAAAAADTASSSDAALIMPANQTPGGVAIGDTVVWKAAQPVILAQAGLLLILRPLANPATLRQLHTDESQQGTSEVPPSALLDVLDLAKLQLYAGNWDNSLRGLPGWHARLSDSNIMHVYAFLSESSEQAEAWLLHAVYQRQLCLKRDRDMAAGGEAGAAGGPGKPTASAGAGPPSRAGPPGMGPPGMGNAPGMGGPQRGPPKPAASSVPNPLLAAGLGKSSSLKSVRGKGLLVRNMSAAPQQSRAEGCEFSGPVQFWNDEAGSWRHATMSIAAGRSMLEVLVNGKRVKEQSLQHVKLKVGLWALATVPPAPMAVHFVISSKRADLCIAVDAVNKLSGWLQALRTWEALG